MKDSKANKPPSRLTIRWRALRRYYMWHMKSGSLPLYLMAGYPKSGGTWFCQMLAGCLDVPFSRNNNKDQMVPSVVHGHYTYHKNYKNVSVLLRDGRDIMVSAYYHFLFYNPNKWSKLHEVNRKQLQFDDYDDIKTNLPVFIEKFMYDIYPSATPVRCSYTEFLDSWMGKGHPIVRYEDLLKDPVEVLYTHFKDLLGKEIPREKIQQVVDKYSFENVTKRAKGQADATKFARKGISGDWKNHFTEEACRVFEKYAGETLIKAGYEKDNSWVEEQIERSKNW